MTDRAPIAISYRPKDPDFLPLIVANLRRYLGNWPIVLLTETAHLPPTSWLNQHDIRAITDWRHSEGANKVLRLWEHQAIFAQHFDRWIWWHDDMLLLRKIEDPERVFGMPRVRAMARERPNKKLNVWHRWLWDTLGFFQCQGIDAPNPVLHIPRLIERESFLALPAHWDRSRLLFEPTYLLWHWHHQNAQPFIDPDFRMAVFAGAIEAHHLEDPREPTILTWGKKIDHEASARCLGSAWPVTFTGTDGL